MCLPLIKNAFQNIKQACQNRIEEIYPKGIPEDINTRYTIELSFLEQSHFIDDFEIFRRLSDETKKSSTISHTRGTLAGSFLYYLLGNNSFNPLPSHYYCTECGYYESVNTDLFGIDLPPKKCPNCNTEILADGYNLAPESVWGNDGKKQIAFEYIVNSDFLPFAQRTLQSIYPDNEIVPWGLSQIGSFYGIPILNQHIIGIELSGYVILPSGNTLQDYPDLISYLENGDPCIIGSSWELEDHMIKPIRLLASEDLDKLISLQRTTGIYVNDIGSKELRTISWSNIYNSTIPDNRLKVLFHEFRPKTYKDMTAYFSSCHNSHSWQKNDEIDIDLRAYKEMISSENFKKYPCFTREDFFDHLVKLGVERKLAYSISERIRKGAAAVGYPKKPLKNCIDLPTPEAFIPIAQNYLYVCPRAHSIEYILIYARLAYYAKIDSRAFGKITFRKKA